VLHVGVRFSARLSAVEQHLDPEATLVGPWVIEEIPRASRCPCPWSPRR
jgi:hypothetical protein